MKIEMSDIAHYDAYNVIKTSHKILILDSEDKGDTNARKITYVSFEGTSSFNIGVNKETTDHLFRNRLSSVDMNTISTIYIAPDSVVPRYRLKELKDKYNITVTRDPKKADLIVLGENSFTKNISSIYVSAIVRTQTLREVVYPLVQKHPAKSSNRVLLQFIDAIEKNMSEELPEFCYMSYPAKRSLDDVIKICSIPQELVYDVLNTGRIVTVQEDKIKSILELCDNQFILDKDFVATFGESIIDNDSYKFIDNLLSSSNAENIEVGLTLMANCNFQKSHAYLILLYYKYKELIYTEYRKLVSYKSLYMFLNQHIVRNIDSLIDCLDKHNLLTDPIKNEIKEIYIKEKNLHKPSTSRITIKNIEIDII